MEAETVANGIIERERGEHITYGVIDPATFSTQGGPSIAETFFAHSVTFHKADNARLARAGALGGWDQLRSRLTGDASGHPMLFFFSSCRHAIRTIPVLQHDDSRAEDLMTDSEDHAADEVRYACMSRPWIRKQPQPAEASRIIRIPTLGELTASHDKQHEQRYSKW
jgi:hypothetical protein